MLKQVGMYLKLVFFSLVFSIYTIYAEIQYDGGFKYILLNKHPYSNPDGAEGFEFTTVINIEQLIHDNVYLLFGHHYWGDNNDNLSPERTIPTSNIFDAGLRLTQFGIFQVNFIHSLYNNAEPLAVPYYPSGMEIIPQTLTTSEASWIGNFDWFHATATVSTPVFISTLQPQDKFLTRDILESDPYGTRRDVDVWFDCGTGIDLPADLALDLHSIIKNDLSNSDFYNINLYRAGLSGMHLFNRNRIIVSWNTGESYLQSKAIQNNGRDDRFRTDGMLRLAFRLNSSLFVKGEASVDVISKLLKQYYELQLRKTWKQGSSIDLLFFTTSGVLFPRQNMTLHSIIHLSEHFELHPEFSIYIAQLPTESHVRYYRSDYKMELLFPMNDRFDFYAGYVFNHYERHPHMASQNSISAGIRTW
jgi:hypothetical protein